MKTKAVRLHGERDLRLEEIELPQIKDHEILAHIISDSICMSSCKAASQGARHKRIPNNVSDEPVIIGHEFCGEMVEIGSKWRHQFSAGDKFSIQPALNYARGPVGIFSAPGYSYQHIGGSSQHVVIPAEVMEQNCLFTYRGDAFYCGSLAEPMACVVGSFHANYHVRPGSYVHEMGIIEGGAMALLAGAGPMGLGAIDLAIHCDRKPALLVVTDIDSGRLDRAASIYTVEEAKSNGVELHYLNTAEKGIGIDYLMSLSPAGSGFNDVFVYAPVRPVIEQADRLLAFDGCLNFFAGPTAPDFSASLNFYNVHYAATHVVGTSGSNAEDMIESLDLMAAGRIDPSAMITHVGGLNAVIETTLNLPNIPGGKKLIYNNIEMPLVALDDLKNQRGDLFKGLAEIVQRRNGLWHPEAERFLLENAPAL